MFRGTTPTIYIHASVDLSDWYIELTVANGSEVKLVKSGDDIVVVPDDGEGCYIYTTLTQSETLTFRSGTDIAVQIRAIKDGTAIASTIGEAEVSKILRNGIITEGGYDGNN